MKICARCEQHKTEDQFHTANRLGGLQSYCKDCSYSYALSRRKDLTVRSNQRAKLKRQTITEYLIKYLEEHPCAQCGDTNVLCLDFHHKYPENKEDSICYFTRVCNWPKLLEEIKKCVVLCARCHRIETHKQLNTLKWQIVSGQLKNEEVSKEEFRKIMSALYTGENRREISELLGVTVNVPYFWASGRTAPSAINRKKYMAILRDNYPRLFEATIEAY